MIRVFNTIREIEWWVWDEHVRYRLNSLKWNASISWTFLYNSEWYDGVAWIQSGALAFREWNANQQGGAAGCSISSSFSSFPSSSPFDLFIFIIPFFFYLFILNEIRSTAATCPHAVATQSHVTFIHTRPTLCHSATVLPSKITFILSYQMGYTLTGFDLLLSNFNQNYCTIQSMYFIRFA